MILLHESDVTREKFFRASQFHFTFVLFVFVMICASLPPHRASLSCSRFDRIQCQFKRSFPRWRKSCKNLASTEKRNKNALLVITFLAALSPTLKKIQLFLQSIKSILAYYTLLANRAPDYYFSSGILYYSRLVIFGLEFR